MDQLSEISCLLVDDDHFMLKTLSKMLDSMGVGSIIQSDNAQDALKYIANRNNHIDVVISDLNMPDMDGVQLLRHLGSLGIPVSVILVSGEDPRLLDSVATLAEQQQLSILGALHKPVRTADIETLLRKHDPVKDYTPDGPGAMVFADELQSAILNGDLTVFFQPQVNVRSGQILGLEALARWQHPEKGWIPPGVFIGIAEKYNMIREITDLVFQKSITEAAKLRAMGFDITVSINFSALALTSLELPEVLCETLSSSGLEPRHIVLEITESTLAADMSVTLDILTRMRLKGFGLSIDDFGTGFSSMEQLHQIPFNELKIDRSFVHGASNNKASRAILESSIALAKKLNIGCVAEGVETEEDWDLIDKLGCDSVQGYFVAKPMPAAEFPTWAHTYAANKTH